MNDYIEVQNVVQRLQEYGAEVTTHSNDWLEKSLGDFAQLWTGRGPVPGHI